MPSRSTVRGAADNVVARYQGLPYQVHHLVGCALKLRAASHLVVVLSNPVQDGCAFEIRRPSVAPLRLGEGRVQGGKGATTAIAAARDCRLVIPGRKPARPGAVELVPLSSAPPSLSSVCTRRGRSSRA